MPSNKNFTIHRRSNNNHDEDEDALNLKYVAPAKYQQVFIFLFLYRPTDKYILILKYCCFFCLLGTFVGSQT